ncbi:circumsporozoite protein-like isoform X1 [Motacilla alba alba]|uniref:circumsporozoite protein-like isoform X1 n=1 Tax=Motacilla alba alba TaxID=1094192 RepID=UPI0018D5237F|nr:circumsporozoite protein-like isoform X1 [Motacilla alba alba]
MSLLRAAKVKRPKEAPAEARDPPGGGGGGDTGVAGARSCARARCPPRRPAAPGAPAAPAASARLADGAGGAGRLRLPIGSPGGAAPPAPAAAANHGLGILHQPSGRRTRRRSGRVGQVACGERRTASARKPLQWPLYSCSPFFLDIFSH